MGKRVIILQDIDILTILFNTLDTQTIYLDSAEEARQVADICEKLGILVEQIVLGDKFVSSYQKHLKQALE